MKGYAAVVAKSTASSRVPGSTSNIAKNVINTSKNDNVRPSSSQSQREKTRVLRDDNKRSSLKMSVPEDCWKSKDVQTFNERGKTKESIPHYQNNRRQAHMPKLEVSSERKINVTVNSNINNNVNIWTRKNEQNIRNVTSTESTDLKNPMLKTFGGEKNLMKDREMENDKKIVSMATGPYHTRQKNNVLNTARIPNQSTHPKQQWINPKCKAKAQKEISRANNHKINSAVANSPIILESTPDTAKHNITSKEDFPSLISPNIINKTDNSNRTHKYLSKIVQYEKKENTHEILQTLQIPPEIPLSKNKKIIENPKTKAKKKVKRLNTNINPETKRKGPTHTFSKDQYQNFPTSIPSIELPFAKNPISNFPTLPPSKKVRQGMKPRKKRLTPLKKKILIERLAQWREHLKDENPDSNTNNDEMNKSISTSSDNQNVHQSQLTNVNNPQSLQTLDHGAQIEHYSSISYLLNYIQQDEINNMDDEEYDEVESDLNDLAQKVGPVKQVYIPRISTDGIMKYTTNKSLEGNSMFPVFIWYENTNDAIASTNCLNGMIVAGNKLVAGILLQDCLSRSQKLDDIDMDSLRSIAMTLDSDDLTLKKDHQMTYRPRSIIPSQEKKHVFMTLQNILTDEDLEDEDCLHESLDDIISLAEQFGVVQKDAIEVLRSGPSKGQMRIMYCGGLDVVENAVRNLNGRLLGGNHIHAEIFYEKNLPKHDNKELLIIKDILSYEDIKDEDCLEECRGDIYEICSKFGEVNEIHIDTSSEKEFLVFVDFLGGGSDALKAAKDLNGMMIGGTSISASMGSLKLNTQLISKYYRNLPLQKKMKEYLVLENILSEDDYEDSECLEETKEDIRKIAEMHGKVDNIHIQVEGMEKGRVIILYVEEGDLTFRAAQDLDGKNIGGNKIIARCISESNLNTKVDSNLGCEKIFHEVKDVADKLEASKEKESIIHDPIFSGNKIIPEQYAACKRVPKIPNPGIPREYSLRIDNDNAIPLVVKMLGELMRLQIRSKDDKNARARRRLVFGLREVARGIRAHKVKMLVMANNLDSYGAIDTKLLEILRLAKQEELPVIFELNKRKLGKALGKTIKVSVVGVQNADGAHEEFKKLKKIATPLK